MTFLQTWAFGFAAIAPVIVLLYLLKLKRRPVSVSTLMFWQRVLQENRHRAFFQRLRQWLSLLLHLLIFALILLALAKPALDRVIRAGASTVVIVDARARMQARESGDETRFQRAVHHALGLVRQAGELRQFALIEAGAAPVVLSPFTGDEKSLQEALSRSRPTDAGGDLEPALALAENLLASRGGERRIVLLSAEAPAPRESAPQGGPELETILIGAPQDNVAITRFAARPLPNSPGTSEVLLDVRNFGAAHAKGNVELKAGDQLLDVKPFDLAPGEHRTEVFPSVPNAGTTGAAGSRGMLTATLDTRDALPVDNVAYAALPAQSVRKVLLVTKGNWFLEKALAADNRVQFELLQPDSFSLPMAEQFDLVVLDNFLPSEFRLGQTAGNFLFIKQTPFAESGGAPIEQPIVTEIDASHPTLQLVSLQNVTLQRAIPQAAPEQTSGWRFESPLKAFDQPLLITGSRQSPNGTLQRVAALGFDLAESDLPLRVAFPLMIGNIIHWLGGEDAEPVLGLRAGESLVLNPGESVLPTEAARSDAASPPAQASGVFQPVKNGFYQLSRAGGAAWVPVNTADVAESNLQAANVPAAAPASSSMHLPGLAGWPWWQYCALAALLLFAMEWWLFHRRQTE